MKNDGSRNERAYLQVETQPKIQEDTESLNPQVAHSKCFDDDGRLKRTGKASDNSFLALVSSNSFVLRTKLMCAATEQHKQYCT